MTEKPMGCLAILFGVGVNRPNQTPPTRQTTEPTDGGMSEGDIHSGPGGYEGMGYSGGYAADYYGDGEGGER